MIGQLLRRPVKLELYPENCLVLEKIGLVSWLNQGPARFNLVPPRGRLPSGWVLLHTRLVHRANERLAVLCWDVGTGFSEENSWYPPISLKGVIHELIQIPQDVRAIHWLPSRVKGGFDQWPLVMTEVGLFERTVRMLGRVLGVFVKYSRARRLSLGLTAWHVLCDLPDAYRLAGRLRALAPAPAYRQWVERFDTLSEADRRLIGAHVSRLARRPRISLLMFVLPGRATGLAQTIDSLHAQLYDSWDLHVVLVSPCDPGLLNALEEQAQRDARIHVLSIPAPPNGESIIADTLRLSNATHVALLGPDDVLTEHALYHVAAEASTHPDAVLIYSDEDCIDASGNRHDPHFKPDWNPQLLLSQNYPGRLCVYRADAISEAGGSDNPLSGALDYDLALRVTARARPDTIRHIPVVLCHRRVMESAAPSDALESGRQALAAHLDRLGIRGAIQPVPAANGYRIQYALPAEAPHVSIIIPTRDGHDLLRRCIDSIGLHSRYRNYEIIVVDNQSTDPGTLDYLATLETGNVASIIRYDFPFNYSRINNLAARSARGEVLCLLNNDTEVITPEWLEEMLGCLMQDKVGVVGAKLLYPDGTVQHGGDLVGVGGIAHHAHAFLGRDDPGYQGRALLAQDLSAVTGACLMVWKSVYEKLGGLDEVHLPVAFNDVDFCLRVREAGWRVVWTPWAELYHHESASRGGNDETAEKRARHRREKHYMRRRWKHVMAHDPAYNPNLSPERPDFSLNHAPVLSRPWEG